MSRPTAGFPHPTALTATDDGGARTGKRITRAPAKKAGEVRVGVGVTLAVGVGESGVGVVRVLWTTGVGFDGDVAVAGADAEVLVDVGVDVEVLVDVGVDVGSEGGDAVPSASFGVGELEVPVGSGSGTVEVGSATVGSGTGVLSIAASVVVTSSGTSSAVAGHAGPTSRRAASAPEPRT